MAADPRVEAYLAKVPERHRALLLRVHQQLRDLLPDATETISYGMPALAVDGKAVVWYAAWKDHCSLYPLTGGLLAAHREQLRPFRMTRGSVHFTADRPLPPPLVEALVRGRLADLGIAAG